MHVRVTGIVIDAGKILLLDQDTDSSWAWSLPGGRSSVEITDLPGGGIAVRDSKKLSRPALCLTAASGQPSARA
ncbi:DUF397 domain-containing protein [Streptomyces sp. OfavH-34-F]|uniref:DUF397 domain-containing protein n=1 Tax=Streptomyces sp. OfavH-34-F TaxID=2917760 RepID=UPI001EF1AC52|nr:DUF397 domain-containing protein [Streptomyces sp. OfavH-34-F]MCG7522946.1 DUF397 domain-containing protein [Streptomyces sp. OfavH-34-F]